MAKDVDEQRAEQLLMRELSGTMNRQTAKKTQGSTSNEKALDLEANRISKVFDASYEATVVFKGRFDINIGQYIKLNIYCKDGTLHYASGEYLVLERTDSIESDFTTTVKVQRMVEGVTAKVSYGAAGSGYSSGVTGKKYVTGVTIPKIEGSGTGEQVVRTALKYVGYPYVWGGSSLTNGCDCSHFVWLVLKECGYDYGYHQSGGWRTIGNPVASSDIRPGDVMCYNGHVAFATGTDGIVHAKGKDYGIVYDKLNPLTYHGGAVAIRRVV